MSKHPSRGFRTRHAAELLAALPLAVLMSCSSDEGVPPERGLMSVHSELSQAERMARYAQIRDAAFGRGINGTAYLLAGIAYAETGLAHCWSEATWACQGPNSPDCGGGPVIAGAADGPCSAQQGGLGMFQFDAGTFTDTINTYGADVLTVAGNVSHAIDYVINMVKISAYTTNAETDAKALQWILDFDLGNATLRDQWIKTVTRYYNGCQPSWSCWSQRYGHYDDSLQTVVDETGLDFWVVPTDKAPSGEVDQADCNVVRGWAQDPDTPADAIDVHLYFDSVPGDPNPATIVIHADQDRPDLCTTLGSCNHGFETAIPRSLLDGAQHTVHAYGINSKASGSNAELGHSPRSFQCPAPAAPIDSQHGVRRHVTGPASFASWKFSWLLDVAHVSDAVLLQYPAGPDWPDTPRLIRADDGSPEVWSIDANTRRHVLSPGDMTAWRFDMAQVETIASSEVAAYAQGPDWAPQPFLMQGGSADVYVIDVAVADEPVDGGVTDAGVEDVGVGTETDSAAGPAEAGAPAHATAMGDVAGVGPCAIRPGSSSPGWPWLMGMGAAAWVWRGRRRGERRR
jgi:hypothetical protein